MNLAGWVERHARRRPGEAALADGERVHCHLARVRCKRPKDYRFVDALPTSNYGNVVKRELRELRQAETENRSA